MFYWPDRTIRRLMTRLTLATELTLKPSGKPTASPLVLTHLFLIGNFNDLRI
jgi:hypothetical protein